MESSGQLLVLSIMYMTMATEQRLEREEKLDKLSDTIADLAVLKDYQSSKT